MSGYCKNGYKTYFDGCGERCTGCLTVIGSIGWACAPKVDRTCDRDRSGPNAVRGPQDGTHAEPGSRNETSPKTSEESSAVTEGQAPK